MPQAVYSHCLPQNACIHLDEIIAYLDQEFIDLALRKQSALDRSGGDLPRSSASRTYPLPSRRIDECVQNLLR